MAEPATEEVATPEADAVPTEGDIVQIEGDVGQIEGDVVQTEVDVTPTDGDIARTVEEVPLTIEDVKPVDETEEPKESTVTEPIPNLEPQPGDEKTEAPVKKTVLLTPDAPAVVTIPNRNMAFDAEATALIIAKKKAAATGLPADTTISHPEEPIIKITDGKIKGIQKRASYRGRFYAFIGIPYAKPPIEELRFQAPQPPDSWKGVKQVSESTKICMQYIAAQDVVIGDEDCLYLNVYTPKLPAGCSKICTGQCSKLMPVMVYIHGGDFMTGTGTNIEALGPDFLIQNEVVLVTINYRLNILGFLCLDRYGAPGNMGLKDQVMALKWVKNNILNFSGDPDNVTIFGISAGGAAVSYHILSRMSKGLFSKAIVQSGSALHHWAFNEDIKSLAYKIPRLYNQEITSDKELHNYLLNLSAPELVKAATLVSVVEHSRGGLFYGFVPTIEKPGRWKPFIKELPYEILNSGKFNHVSVIGGFCTKESLVMLTADKVNYVHKIIADKDLCARLPFELNPQLAAYYCDLLDQIYFVDDCDLKSDAFALDFLTDIDHLGPSVVHISMLAKKCTEPIYFYEFAYNGPFNYNTERLGIHRLGPCHGDDMGYLFRIADLKEELKKIKPKDTSVRTQMALMWTNFAKYGNPTPMVDKLVTARWDKITKDGPLNYLRISDKTEMRENLFPNRMFIYHDLYSRYHVAKTIIKTEE